MDKRTAKEKPFKPGKNPVKPPFLSQSCPFQVFLSPEFLISVFPLVFSAPPILSILQSVPASAPFVLH